MVKTVNRRMGNPVARSFTNNNKKKEEKSCRTPNKFALKTQKASLRG